MTVADSETKDAITALRERAKELDCLYRVDELLNHPHDDHEETLRHVVRVIPDGWQYPDSCCAKLTVADRTFQSGDFQVTPWKLASEIVVNGNVIGEVLVYYRKSFPEAGEGPFLREERRLLDALAERIGHFFMQGVLRQMLEKHPSKPGEEPTENTRQWGVILDFLRRTDRELLLRITRKMINYLGWNGVEDAKRLLNEYTQGEQSEAVATGGNRPLERFNGFDFTSLAEKTFRIAAHNLSEEEMVSCLQRWIKEAQSSFLVESLESLATSLPEITGAMERYRGIEVEESSLSQAVQTGLRVSLLRRFFVDDINLLNVAKNYVNVDDFQDLVRHIVSTSRSHGRLGGKSAGLFVAGSILRKSKEHPDLFRNVRIPRTWYITSDGLMEFLRLNQLEDVYNRKYMEIEQVRREYPHVVQVFKNSRFPKEIVQGLSMALDDLDGGPLIVRSSSLLEDRAGSTFSGKYKSLFLANQGSKQERLGALLDAVAEVYASVFGPDPIEYREERGLLDVHEEMGVMIQEVVGKRIGRYFCPAFAGVAFSRNEFRWSPRIRTHDGLVRMVPGLGTRAVDRLSDDYPILAAPGQPDLRVNVTPDEVMRYTPSKMDIINLETGVFETVEVNDLLREFGDRYPRVRDLVSVVEEKRIRKPGGLGPDFEKDDLVVTLEGVVSDRSFMNLMSSMLNVLQEKLGFPVDVEFASDGEHIYLLQCRSQSRSADITPAAIPRDIPRDRILFNANRYVSSGRVPAISHIVYVDPEGYNSLGDLEDLKQVGRAVGSLNKILPKRQFILMGPGRWGSRGDIRLGVNVTYSDINNTAVLVEMARRKSNYTPDLSFGTHFFQDLVESGIRYLPLYPDEEGTIFNEVFLTRSRNYLPELLPEFAHLAGVVHVIDVPYERNGQVLQVLLNGDLEEAVGVFGPPEETAGPAGETGEDFDTWSSEDHWRWRRLMAEQIACRLDPDRFGVKAVYLIGSAKNATAGPASDIDLLIHITGDERRREALELWLNGWSQSLSEINYLRTGYRTKDLLDVHLITDVDISEQTSFAAKIGAVTDAAQPLPLGGKAGA
jgi:predicted nucleotidyltransferase